MEEVSYTLSQLSSIIKEVINRSFPQPLWIKAEISEIHENRNGNCYLELIEKDNQTDKIISRFRGIIWDRTFRMLKPYFEQASQSELKAGINVLLKIQIEYSDVYGISLMVLDIDPAYTVGDMEMKKAMVMQQLMADGIFEMNKELEFPLVPQRIGVISSDTAAGYEDFCHQLTTNEEGFVFHVKLFKAYMQGDMAEKSIIAALDAISDENFDVVVITRGGGSRSDLACFDTYNLASHVCQFPLPVISAIGHERDTSIVDLVAHKRTKTPTAAADFIIEQTTSFWYSIVHYYEQIMENISSRINEQNIILDQTEKSILSVKNAVQRRFQTIQYLSEKIQWMTRKKMQTQEQQLNLIKSTLFPSVVHQLKLHEQKITMLNKTIDACNPKHILKKGYSITLKNGKTVRQINDVTMGDEITTILKEGKIISVVK